MLEQHTKSAVLSQWFQDLSSDDAGASPTATIKDAGTPGQLAYDMIMQVAPFGLNHFAAIVPDVGFRDSIVCQFPRDADRFIGWVNGMDGQCNVYWTGNEVRNGFEGNKPTGTDIAGIRIAHVDIDVPGANGDSDLAELRKRAEERLPAELCPTLTVCTGGGFQLIFALADTLPAAEVADRVEGINRALINLLGGDAGTWNKDRLLRVAGPMNLPDARKRAKGRTPRRACVVAKSARAYTLEDLEAIVPPVDAPTATDRNDRVTELIEEFRFGAYETITSVADLEPSLQLKLEAALEASPKLARAWAGDFSGTAAAKGSGKRVTIALLLAHHGDFSAEEFASLIWLWAVDNEGVDYAEAKLQPRDIARLWARKGEPATEARTTRADILARSYEHLEADAPAGVPGLRVITGPIDATKIPRREWLVYPRLPIGDASQLVGEPGVSKSSHTLLDALAVATGNERLLRGRSDAGFDRLLNSGAVAVYNAEDWLADMERRLKVLMDHHGITKDMLQHPIHLLSGMEAPPLVIMERKERGMPLQRTSGADKFEAYLKRNAIKLAILDPQISLARGGIENDTDAMNDIMQEMANIAARARCAVLVVQHTAKSTRNAAGDMGAARGAFSQVGKIRSGYTLVKVDPKDAEAWGLDPKEKLIRMDYSKNNHAVVPDTPVVYRRHSGMVGNGDQTKLFGSADAPFAETSAERFAREGDSAPYLELVGLGVAVGQAADENNSGPSKEAAKRTAVAQIVADALAGQPEGKLREILHVVTRGVQDAGFTKSDAPHVVTAIVTNALSGAGQLAIADGQIVRMSVEKRGAGEKAPWFVMAKAEGEASEARNSVFA